jgi:SNF2 family DNA or RNA helicase
MNINQSFLTNYSGNFYKLQVTDFDSYLDIEITKDEFIKKSSLAPENISFGELYLSEENLYKFIKYLVERIDLSDKLNFQEEDSHYSIQIPTYIVKSKGMQTLSLVGIGALVAPLLMKKVNSDMLREYQNTGVDWLLQNNDGILADDMGLGKTLQSIKAMDVLIRLGEVNKVLIVCPSSLISTWKYEISKWAPHIAITQVLGDKNSINTNWLKAYSNSHILITNYEQLRGDIEVLDSISFDLVIADEAHRIRKLSSKLSKGILKIKRERFWALTGTPIENNTEDLISLLKHINPKKFSFLDKKKNELILREYARPYVLRRLKEQVLNDLPEVIENNIAVELTPVQRKKYMETLENKSKLISENGSYFAVLGQLRATCEGFGLENSSKVNKAAEIIEIIASRDEKVIVFSYFIEPLTELEKKLRKKKINYSKIIGEDSRDVREKNISEFKNQHIKTVLLASSKVASEGLTLTEANNVIFLNKWWNPSSNHQARDRVVRIGQDKTVQVFNLFCIDTIEERVVDILEEKEEVYKNIIDGLVDEEYISKIIQDEILT